MMQKSNRKSNKNEYAKYKKISIAILITSLYSFYGISFAATNIDGTSSGGHVSINSGNYNSIIGFRQSKDQPITSFASVTLADPNNLYSIEDSVHALTVTDIEEDKIPTGSFVQLSNIQISFSSSGASDKYMDAVNVSPSSSDRRQILTLKSNALNIYNSTINSNTRPYLSSVASQDVLNLHQLIVENNITKVENSNLKVGSIAAVKFSSLNGDNIYLNKNSLQANKSSIEGTLYGAMGRPTADGRISAVENSIQLKDSIINGYLIAFTTTNVNYKTLIADNNYIHIDNTVVNNSSNVSAVSSQQISAGVSETFLSDNTINIVNNSKINNLYAVVVQTSNSGSNYMKNDYYLKNNKIITEDSHLSGDQTYATWAGITSWTPQDEGNITITGSEISFNRTTFDGKYLHAAYAASRAGSSYISDTKVSYINSIVKPSGYSYDNIIFASNGGNGTITNSLTEIESSSLTGTFGSAALVINNGVGKVSNNKYIISGSSILNGNFYLADVSAPNIEITDNQFIISGSSNLQNANLYGYSISQSENTLIHNNSITFAAWNDGNKNTINSLQNFNQIKFGPILWKDKGAVITLQTGENSLSHTSISSAGDAWVLVSEAKPVKGEYMYLIDGSAVNSNSDSNQTIGLKPANFDRDIRFHLKDSTLLEGKAHLALTDNGSLKMTIDGYSSSSQSLILVENRAAAVAFLNNGNDLIVDSLDISYHSNNAPTGFALIQGEALRYDTSSRIKLNGFHSIFGSGVNLNDNWNLIGFFETGNANYRTQNVFLGESFRGDGEIEYWGIGLATKYKISSEISSHIGLQFGKLKTNISNALRNSEGIFFDLKDYSWYWSSQIGLNWNKKIQTGYLDLYGRYIHSQIAGDSTNVGHEQLNFETVQSNRFRFGIRNNIIVSKSLDINAGLGWDYETNAKAFMSVGKIDAPTQSLKGSTFFGELGTKWTTNVFAIEGRVRGFTGVTSGWEGQIRGRITF